MEKFKPLEDFIEDIEKEICPTSVTIENDKAANDWRRVVSRKNFGKPKQKLGDFIACDKEGKPLEYPKEEMFYRVKDSTQSWGDYLAKQYSEGLKQVKFEGFKMEGGILFWDNTSVKWSIQDDLNNSNQTIECLTKYKLTLTKTGSNKMKNL